MGTWCASRRGVGVCDEMILGEIEDISDNKSHLISSELLTGVPMQDTRDPFSLGGKEYYKLFKVQFIQSQKKVHT